MHDYARIRERVSSVLESALSADDPVVKSHLAVLACVLISGQIESACRHWLGVYSSKRSTPSIGKFVASKLKRVTNLKALELIELLASFDAEKSKAVQDRLDEEAKDAIDSVVGRRHQIAHGEVAGLGLASVQKWNRAIQPVLKEIEDQFSC